MGKKVDGRDGIYGYALDLRSVVGGEAGDNATGVPRVDFEALTLRAAAPGSADRS
jgi:hypothetical protein